MEIGREVGAVAGEFGRDVAAVGEALGGDWKRRVALAFGDVGVALPPGDRCDGGEEHDENNELYQVVMQTKENGVEPYEGSVKYVKAARDAGLRRAVVSSSANTKDVLVAAGIEDLFEARIDGIVADERHLKGKPAPDTFLAGAEALGVQAADAVVYEDALAGVQAGRDGHLGFVVGVDRVFSEGGRLELHRAFRAGEIRAGMDTECIR